MTNSKENLVGIVLLGIFAIAALFLKESNLSSVAIGVIGGYISHNGATTSTASTGV